MLVKLGSCACPDSPGGRHAAYALAHKAAARSVSSPGRFARSGRSLRPDRSAGTGTRIPSRLQIQDAAGESVGDRVVEILAPPVDVLAADPHQWQRRSPCGLADRPELDLTVAFRFASPVMDHSKPRFNSVGCSTTNFPACVAFCA